MKMKAFRSILFILLAVFAFSVASAGQAKTLYLYNWSQYMDPAILKAFKKKYHVEISRNFFGSNPELFAKLQAGGDSQYDVVFPSSYYVPRLAHSGLLQPLNKSLIPNLDNLWPRFQNPSYDPHNKHSAPYQWGDTGIAYNTRDLPNAPASWAILFKSKVNPKYPFAMITDPQVQFGAACAYLGLGYNCIGKKKWKKAAKLILKTKQRSNFSGFTDGTPVLRRLARGDVTVGVTFNGDYVHFKKRNPKVYADIKFIVPKEGTELWMDTMAIPAHAPHPKLANKFINFILEAKVGAMLSNYNAYTSPNKAAQPYLHKALTKPPIMPTAAQLKTLHYTPPLKGNQLQFVQQLWTEVKSR